MPPVRPFRGIGYALDRFGGAVVPDRVRLPEEPTLHSGRIADLSDIACPPYDVIGSDEQSVLVARSPVNAVQLELSPEADPHATAARTLVAWLGDGTLERRREPSVYYYAHGTPATPGDPSVRGVLAQVRLEPYGNGVRAHEHTMAAPKADRLALLRSTHTQLSPILALYFDRSERYRQVMSRAWTDEWRARDGDGLLHTLAAIEPDERLLSYLARQTLFIADGHHRYETALAYQAEVRGRPEHRAAAPGSLAADWVMIVLVNAELEEVEIRATHRLVRDVNPEALRSIATDSRGIFDVTPTAPDQLPRHLEELGAAVEVAFGLVLAADEGYLLVGDVARIADRMRREPVSSAIQRLDVAVLHAVLIADRLGMDPTSAAGERILYTTSPLDAIARVRNDDVQAAFLVRPTRLHQLAAVATAGDVMPQKSTYFYPKLLTGLVFASLEGD